MNFHFPLQFRIRKEGGHWNIGDMWIKILDIILESEVVPEPPIYSPNAPVNDGGVSIVYLMNLLK